MQMPVFNMHISHRDLSEGSWKSCFEYSLDYCITDESLLITLYASFVTGEYYMPYNMVV